MWSCDYQQSASASVCVLHISKAGICKAMVFCSSYRSVLVVRVTWVLLLLLCGYAVSMGWCYRSDSFVVMLNSNTAYMYKLQHPTVASC